MKGKKIQQWTIMPRSRTIVQQIVFCQQGFATDVIDVQILRCVGSHRFQLSQSSTNSNEVISKYVAQIREATSSIQNNMTIG